MADPGTTPTSDSADVVIVGGGIVGLATAHQLLASNPRLRTVVLDKEPVVAKHQTGHNSGVLHSGIYYRPGSRKAELATSGRAMMVEFCRRHGIEHDICGKVVVATTDRDLPRLDALAERAAANGVEAHRIGPGELQELEPNAAGLAALHVPVSGITDYGQVSHRMAKNIVEAGGEVRTGTLVTNIEERPGAVIVETDAGAIRSSLVVTCGGLQSDRLARHTVPDTAERIMPFRGEYYELVEERRSLVKNLIYPVPDPDFPFLGVHLTRMIDGSIHAGPNAVLALAREGYTWRDVDFRDLGEVLANPGWWRLARTYWRTGLGEYYRSLSKRAFVSALQRLVPAIEADDLVAAPAGVRAQAVGRNGALLDDFVWSETARVVNVLNAPSPAATASLAIGDAIVERLLTHQF